VKKVARDHDRWYEPRSLDFPCLLDSLRASAQPVHVVGGKSLKGFLVARPGGNRFEFCEGDIFEFPADLFEVEVFVVPEELGVVAVVVDPLPHYFVGPSQVVISLSLVKT